MIAQFVEDVVWGELDFLLIDTPPGTLPRHTLSWTTDVVNELIQELRTNTLRSLKSYEIISRMGGS